MSEDKSYIFLGSGINRSLVAQDLEGALVQLVSIKGRLPNTMGPVPKGDFRVTNESSYKFFPNGEFSDTLFDTTW
jgi:hypothetical protein